MGIESIIDDQRQRYVDFFKLEVDRLRASESNVAPELLISINNEELIYPYRYMRADVVAEGSSNQPKVFKLETDADPNFEACGFNFGSFQVECYPFVWDNIQILFDKEPTNLRQLEGWITRWLDVEDTAVNGFDGLTGAVHSFTPVETNGDWRYLTADFGTAPADALIELIELLASQGMTRIVLKAG